MPDILVAESVSKIYFDTAPGTRCWRLTASRSASRSTSSFPSSVPPGCGKSTFLRIVAGLERPTAGEILVSGSKVTGPGADRGMVFQEYALLPWKTTGANIEFGLQLKKIPPEERAPSSSASSIWSG